MGPLAASDSQLRPARGRHERRSYERHRPEDGVLYAVVQVELETFLTRARLHGQPVPRFIEREFRAYLRCGVLAHGFLRLHCDGAAMRRACGGRGSGSHGREGTVGPRGSGAKRGARGPTGAQGRWGTPDRRGGPRLDSGLLDLGCATCERLPDVRTRVGEGAREVGALKTSYSSRLVYFRMLS